MMSIHPHNINIIPRWLFMQFIDIMLLAHWNTCFGGGAKWMWNSVNNVKISLMLLFSHLCGVEFMSQRRILIAYSPPHPPVTPREEGGGSVWEGVRGVSEPELCVILLCPFKVNAAVCPSWGGQHQCFSEWRNKIINHCGSAVRLTHLKFKYNYTTVLVWHEPNMSVGLGSVSLTGSDIK